MKMIRAESAAVAVANIDKDEHEMLLYLVNDELILIKTLQGFLEDLGHEVVSFTSIPRLFERNYPSPDLILIDPRGPVQSSLKCLCEIHERYPDTAIVVIDSVLPYEDAVSCGVYSYIGKPIRLGELELLLKRVSERKNNPLIRNKII